MSSKPFYEIIFDICGKHVIPFNIDDPRDVGLRDDIYKVCMDTCRFLKEEPIISRRVNEVGNKIEPYVRHFFNLLEGYKASIPDGRATGYPDILLIEYDNRYTYIECKTYNLDSIKTTFRSFYFSYSETFKIRHDARHLVIGFEISAIGEQQYRPLGFKMVDAHDLPCTLKKEWNSNNKLLYGLPILSQYKENN